MEKTWEECEEYFETRQTEIDPQKYDSYGYNSRYSGYGEEMKDVKPDDPINEDTSDSDQDQTEPEKKVSFLFFFFLYKKHKLTFSFLFYFNFKKKNRL